MKFDLFTNCKQGYHDICRWTVDLKVVRWDVPGLSGSVDSRVVETLVCYCPCHDDECNDEDIVRQAQRERNRKFMELLGGEFHL